MLDPSAWAIVLSGAAIAGFTVGFAGFGTGLVAAGFWFYALPAESVPPLICLASIAAQLTSLWMVRTAFAWRRASPYLLGGVAGVPIGVLALSVASPDTLRLTVGVFLIAYAVYQVGGFARRLSLARTSTLADSAVGCGGGILGGFAGLSGPLPVIWLQLKGGQSAEQRAVYQPFNLVVLILASAGMIVGGQIDVAVATVAAGAVPVTLISTWIGAKAYGRSSEKFFRRVVLGLLLASGMILTFQAVI